MNTRLPSAARRFGFWTACAAAVVFHLSPALAPTASAAQNRWEPGVYMTEAVANVMAGAKAVSDFSEYGYTPNTCFLAAFLKQRGSAAMNVPMERGTAYMILGGGDSDATDVDIDVTDEAGRVVARDNKDDGSPVVLFTPARSGKYAVRLTLWSGARSSFCAMAILQRGGYDVPVRNLSAATANLIAYCESVDSSTSRTVRFHDSDNQWAIYGTVLRQGEGTDITNIRPANDDLVFVSAGDTVARDIDLFLLDDGGRTIGQDIDADANPLIVHRANGFTSYGLRTKVITSSGGGATLVLTAVLEIE